MKIKDKVVIITGASGGIGRSLSMALGNQGAIVVLASRSQDKLKELQSILNGSDIRNHLILFDCTSPESIKNLVKETMEKYGKIDLLINNAGVGLFESILYSKENDISTVFNTNFFGPLQLMQQVVPHMKNGLVVNISSAAAKYAPYHFGVYSATKAALERITEALGVEAGNARTLLVISDRTRTRFMEHVIGPKENAKLPLKLIPTEPDVVAKRIVAAMLKDKSVCYTTLRSRAYAVLSVVWPGLVKKVIQESRV